METRICRICGIEKDISCFRIYKKYYRTECKECENRLCKERNLKNREHILKKEKEYRENHKDQIKKYKKEHYNPIESKKYNKKYYQNHKEYYAKKHKEYSLKNRDKINKNVKNWKEKNIDKVRKYQRRDYEKRNKNYIKKLELQLRNMLNQSFKRKKYLKSKKLETIVGLNSKEMIDYLLQTFKNNYGYEWDKIEKIHIDHIKPLKYAQTEEEVIKLCHYTNLQLLKAKDNLQKNCKIDWKLER